MSNNQQQLIKKYFNLLVQQFISNRSNISIKIVFKDYLGGQTLGNTSWDWEGINKKEVFSGKHSFEVSFLNHYEDEERWRGTVTHEFAHLYLFSTIGSHTHDDRFYSHMERFENWLDQNQGLTPRQDKSGDWLQHIDSSKYEEKQKKTCTSCGKREIPYTTSGNCFQCYQNQVERNQETERENQRTEANNREQKKEQKEFDHLDNLIKNSKDLAELERNWQAVQNSPLYSSNKRTFKKYTDGEEFIDNKTELDKYYTNYKSRFQTSQGKGNSNNSEQKEFNRLVDSLRNSKNLDELEQVWKEIKNSSVYSDNKYNWENKSLSNKKGLDNEYNDRKSHFQSQNSSNPKCDECQKPINRNIYYSKSNQVICKECYDAERERERERE
ncbi:MAG: SprT-like domain-containing protein, partial [Candidatus Moeniiplasma glomeromycotorum]|nr:SprT-like domain-containing protein [Candidatus Moeniiplasma glomeromycotorum]MCE8169788.1 SprT-like domain-containing protein [Candidatus Moeniiplasma glomeromycotorum]